MLEDCPLPTNTPPAYTDAPEESNKAVGRAELMKINITDTKQQEFKRPGGNSAMKRKVSDELSLPTVKRIDHTEKAHSPQDLPLPPTPSTAAVVVSAVNTDQMAGSVVQHPQSKDSIDSNFAQQEHNSELSKVADASNAVAVAPALEDDSAGFLLDDSLNYLFEDGLLEDDDDEAQVETILEQDATSAKPNDNRDTQEMSPPVSPPTSKPVTSINKKAAKAGTARRVGRATPITEAKKTVSNAPITEAKKVVSAKCKEHEINYGRPQHEVDTADRKKYKNLTSGKNLLKTSMKAFHNEQATRNSHLQSVKQVRNPTAPAPVRKVGVLPTPEAANPNREFKTREARILKPIPDNNSKPTPANLQFPHPDDASITVVKFPKSSKGVIHQGSMIPIQQLIDDRAFHVAWPHVRIMGDFDGDKSHWRLEKQMVTPDERIAMSNANRKLLTTHNRREGAKNRLSSKQRLRPNARGVRIDTHVTNTDSLVSGISASRSGTSPVAEHTTTAGSANRVASGRVDKCARPRNS
jgi:hypothetical protein